jgi:hypothetical protein
VSRWSGNLVRHVTRATVVATLVVVPPAPAAANPDAPVVRTDASLVRGTVTDG